ncbi:MAG: class I SAM-dependent methyltransferase [Deltaproteobacteria bacterium]|nr:class I SAM-dependent methyltransferase [Deltaproteobacteria bacterium]MBW2446189.1 class I SAM-dependent methyltransferase [Deltaproteobacteria bacterium]
MPKSAWLSEELHAYIVAHGTEPDAVQQSLIEETAKLGGISMMQIAPEQGTFMTLLVRALGAKRVLEVGTFTGYSALCIARALPDDGELLCCDVSDEWTSIGKPYWEKAGVAHKIDLKIAPAVETLAALPEDESWDMAFIDADKPNYPNYFEAILPRLKPNGVILVDNVLWSGNVAKPDADDDNTKAIRAFNKKVADDPRVEAAIIPLGDGITLLRKK